MDYMISVLESLLPDAQTTQWVFLIVVGVGVFALALAILFLLFSFFDPLQSRLKKLTQEKQQQKSWLQDASTALKPITRHVEPKQNQEQTRMKQQLIHAGYRHPNALGMLYAIKIIMLVLLPTLVLFWGLLHPGLTVEKVGYFALIMGAIGFMLPNVLLRRAVTKRQRRLHNGFPDALDLLVVCTEAGLGLRAAIQRVADELSVSQGELAAELAAVNAEMRAGVESINALKNLVERTGLTDIRGLVVMLSQSMRFGTSVAETLRIYAREFREKRMQKAEEQAAKISIKLLFPLALCFLPAFLIVGLGPVVIAVGKVMNP